MRMSRFLRIVLVFVVLMALTCSASVYAADAGNEWAKIVEAARKEGKVVVYGPPGQNRRTALVEEFEKEYPGITVEYVAGSLRQLAPRMLAEQKAGKYIVDLLIGGSTVAVTRLKRNGALAPIRPYLVLSEVTDPSAWFKNKLWFADQDETHVMMFQGSVSNILAYNTNMLRGDEITSYWDIVEPQWKGKIVAGDVRRPGPGGGQSRFLYAHKDLGPEYLKRLFGETDITLSMDRRQMVDWLAQGRFAIHVFPNSIDIDRAIEQGLPVKILPPDQLKEGAPLTAGWGTVSVGKRPPHPNAAKVYLNWLLSKKGQLAWQKYTGDASLRKDISKENVSSYSIPREDKEYFFGSLEDHMKISGRKVRNLVSEAVEAGTTK